MEVRTGSTGGGKEEVRVRGGVQKGRSERNRCRYIPSCCPDCQK